MTILILFHASGYRDLKTFYTRHVAEQMAGDFPRLVSYGRFVELHHARVTEQRTADGDALALATGEAGDRCPQRGDPHAE